MSKTPEQQRQQDREEMARSWMGLFGDIAKTGFWGVLLAGIVAFAGNALMQTEGGQKFIENNLGLQGMYAANAFRGFFGLDPIFGEDELRSAVLALEPEKLNDLIQSQLSGDKLLLGDNMIEHLLSDEHRETTFELLSDQGFTFSNPESLTPEVVQGALETAAKDPNKYGSLMEGFLKATVTDIQEIKSEDQKHNKGLLETMKSSVASWFSEEKTQTPQTGGLLNMVALTDIMKNYPEMGIAITAAFSDNQQLSALLEANSAQIAALVKNVDASEIETILGAVKDLLGSEKEAFSVKDFINNTQLLNTFRNNREAIETFLKDLNVSALTEDQQKQIQAARGFLLGDSDVAGKSNFAVIADLAEKPEVLKTVGDVLDQYMQGDQTEIENLSINPEIAELASSAIRDLDFDSKAFMNLLKSADRGTARALKGIANDLGDISITDEDRDELVLDIEDLLADMTGGKLDPDVIKKINTEAKNQDSKEGGMDQLIGMAAISTLKQAAAQR